jgi:hypothetical protein
VLSVLIYPDKEPLKPRKLITLLLIAISLVLLWWDRKQTGEPVPQTEQPLTVEGD